MVVFITYLIAQRWNVKRFYVRCDKRRLTRGQKWYGETFLFALIDFLPHFTFSAFIPLLFCSFRFFRYPPCSLSPPHFPILFSLYLKRTLYISFPSITPSFLISNILGFMRLPPTVVVHVVARPGRASHLRPRFFLPGK